MRPARLPPPVSVPVGFTTFPGEVWLPRSWVEMVLPQPYVLQRGRQGGHFAAWKSPSCRDRDPDRPQPAALTTAALGFDCEDLSTTT